MDILSGAPILVGVDVGQKVDPSCIAVVEAKQVHRGRQRIARHVPAGVTNSGYREAYDEWEKVFETEYTILSIRPLPLQTSYLEVGERIASILCDDRVLHRERTLRVDVTGVGAPVLEVIQGALSSRAGASGVIVKGITFTHGDKYDNHTGVMGKAFLVSRLQSLIQQQLIAAPDVPSVRDMIEELKVYEIKIDQDGNDKYGAFKVGTHDDMVTALGLAILEDPFAQRISSFPDIWLK